LWNHFFLPFPRPFSFKINSF
jgi:hypothetical protein